MKRKQVKYICEDLPKPTPEQEDNYVKSVPEMIDLSKELKLTKNKLLDLVAKDWDELQKETRPKEQRLLKEGYPPRLATKVALGFNPKSKL